MASAGAKKRLEEERRKNQRIYFLTKLRFRRETDRQFKSTLACHDISGGGLRVLTEEMFRRGERARVLIHLEDKTPPIRAICRAAWCAQNEKGRYSVGFEFTRMEGQERFTEYFCQKLIDFHLN